MKTKNRQAHQKSIYKRCDEFFIFAKNIQFFKNSSINRGKYHNSKHKNPFNLCTNPKKVQENPHYMSFY